MNMKILGTGSYLPEKLLTNADLEKMVDTTDEWITKRVGIKVRHICREDEFASDMAVIAGRRALEASGLAPEDIQLILVATISNEMHTPSVSCVVHKELGTVNAAAVDVNTACSGFVSAMILADQFIKTGAYQNILVIASDTMSKYTDWKDRASCVLFGDGAGAAVVTADEKAVGVLSHEMGADGESGKHITIPSLKFTPEDLERRNGERARTFWMDGSEVYKFAVRVMTASTLRIVEQAGLTMDDIQMVIPHQANIRIIEGSAKRLKIGADRMYANIDHTGNMSSACIPVALDEVVQKGLIKRGDKVVLVGMGGGMTWASMLFEY